MADINISAEARELATKGTVNKMRREGRVPGVLYSKEMEPIKFSVNIKDLNPVIYTTEMHLVNLKIDDNKEIKSILKDVQFDPLTDKIIHVDFQAIKVGEVIEVQVPINVLGQAPGIKEGGVLNQSLHKFDIECLPRDIPEYLEVDISELNIGDSILVKDLSFENIKILNSEETNVLGIIAPREEATEQTEDELMDDGETAEPEVISKGKAEEEENN
ncbi:MAG: 50S ribosomal protein L25 [Ignavibacteriae bacterium]|nr:MAG: 50S ribosomal protein L25 [Ignavibacteriota bacterium]